MVLLILNIYLSIVLHFWQSTAGPQPSLLIFRMWFFQEKSNTAPLEIISNFSVVKKDCEVGALAGCKIPSMMAGVDGMIYVWTSLSNSPTSATQFATISSKSLRIFVIVASTLPTSITLPKEAKGCLVNSNFISLPESKLWNIVKFFERWAAIKEDKSWMPARNTITKPSLKVCREKVSSLGQQKSSLFHLEISP